MTIVNAILYLIRMVQYLILFFNFRFRKVRSFRHCLKLRKYDIYVEPFYENVVFQAVIDVYYLYFVCTLQVFELIDLTNWVIF